MHEFYVAPDGSDRSSGGADDPFATLERARDALRGTRGGRIVLRGGCYYEVSLRLGAEDAGVTIEAAPGESPVLYGGQRVTGWEEDQEGFYCADVPGVREGEWDFRALVVNGRLAQRARFPETGRLEHEDQFDVRWRSTTAGGWEREPTEEELTTLHYKDGDLGEWLDTNNAEITLYHQWDESMVGVKEIEGESRRVKFSNPAGHPPGAFANRGSGAGTTYVVWNTREGMRRPGQWYLDRTRGRILYRPLPEEEMSEAHVVAPTTERIICIDGAEEAPVEDVTIRGLRLSATNTPLRAGGFGASNFEGAITARHAPGIRIEDVGVENVAGHGMSLGRCPDATVGRCEAVSAGAGGIYVRGKGSVIEDCLIERVGRMYPSAIGLRAGGGMRVRHNDIRRTPYSAINAGGGEDTVIEYNRIERAMQRLHDGAAIYVTFCRDYVLRDNVALEITASDAHAYYLDEQAEGCVVEGNLAVGCPWPSHNHMARSNVIRNNVFVHSGEMLLTFPKCEAFRFERNVLWAEGTITFRQFDAIESMPDNVIYSVAGSVEVARGTDYEPGKVEELKPREGTILTDPMLVDPDGGDCRFRRETPAFGRGIEPLSVRKAGRRAGKSE
jgi:hypothetical protein